MAITRSNVADVIRYYNKTESRIGYNLFLGGTKHFGLFGQNDHWWHWRRSLHNMEDLLAHTLAVPAGSLVLDAGCGMGEVAMRLVTEHGLSVVGIDILDFNLDGARARASRRRLDHLIKFEEMSYDSLSYADDSFDGIYTVETLVHAADAQKVLNEFFRVLKPGGRIALLEYSRAPQHLMPSEAAEAYTYINQVAAMPSFQRFTYGTLERLLSESGFDNVKSVDLTENILPMLKVFSAVGYLPYQILKRLGRQEKVINAMSGVEFWKHRAFFKYKVYSASKPAT